MSEAASLGAIVDAHNAVRAEHGLAPLMFSPVLTAVALDWAAAMCESGKCTHGSGTSTFDKRIRARGYEGEHIGENVALGQASLDEVMKDWMGSAGHRRAILESRYTEIGVGVVGRAWCVDFGGSLEQGVRGV